MNLLEMSEDPEFRAKIRFLVSRLVTDPDAHKAMGISKLSDYMQFVDGVPVYFSLYGDQREGHSYIVTMPDFEFGLNMAGHKKGEHIDFSVCAYSMELQGNTHPPIALSESQKEIVTKAWEKLEAAAYSYSSG